MQIGVSTACYYPLETEKTLELIAETGAKVIEVFVNSASEYSNEYIKDFKKSLKSFGLELYSFHPFTSFAEPYLFFSGYQRRVEDSIEYYRYQFKAAAQMGAKVFNFHGDSIKSHSEDGFYFDLYFKLFEKAKQEGIIFSQENVSRCKSAKPHFLAKMREQLGENIRFTFDVKQANRAGVTPYEIYHVMKGKIANLHISDFDEERDCLLPSYGKFDLKEFLTILVKEGYNGPALIEVYRENYMYYDQIKKSVEFFKY
jgi:sugar phosphate isomerase/epimerase